ncbi:MAG: hypothetical protein LKI92_07345 [Schleiferilactobacillus harbinensis]|jgi:hypothetical protein|nr:hypothetical protein [Schleiferilactobacillus harbinensis]MCI1913650.1 hypothetical protein [Schleiferilactobacillus harbinensis]
MTNKQRFVFTLSMSFGMATIMSLLGNVLAKGWNAVTLTSWFIWWLPTVTIAFTYSWFVAAKITNFLVTKATRKLTSPTAVSRRAAGVRSRMMLLLMYSVMSTFGLLIGGAFQHVPFMALLWIWARSLIIAIIVRGLVVKPLSSFIVAHFFTPKQD